MTAWNPRTSTQLALTGGTPAVLPQPAVASSGGHGEVLYGLDNPAGTQIVFMLGSATETAWTARQVAVGAIVELPSVKWTGIGPYACLRQVTTYLVGGNGDGDYTITVAGTPYTYAAAGNTPTQIRDALLALLVAAALSAVADGVASIILTAARPVCRFTSAVVSPGSVLTQTHNTATVTVTPWTSGAP